jgi:hypothetical protein
MAERCEAAGTWLRGCGPFRMPGLTPARQVVAYGCLGAPKGTIRQTKARA